MRLLWFHPKASRPQRTRKNSPQKTNKGLKKVDKEQPLKKIKIPTHSLFQKGEKSMQEEATYAQKKMSARLFDRKQTQQDLMRCQILQCKFNVNFDKEGKKSLLN